MGGNTVGAKPILGEPKPTRGLDFTHPGTPTYRLLESKSTSFFNITIDIDVRPGYRSKYCGVVKSKSGERPVDFSSV
jgi:hypothetical protein